MPLKNRFNVPAVPVFWRDEASGHRIEWRTAHETFIDWCLKVWAFCDGNKRGRPPESHLEDVACAHFPRSFCTQETNYRAPHMVAQGGGGCGSCGGRK